MSERGRGALIVFVLVVLLIGMIAGGRAWWEDRQQRRAVEWISEQLLVGCLTAAQDAPDPSAATDRCLEDHEDYLRRVRHP